MRQRSCGEEYLCSLERMVKEMKKMLVVTFDEYRDSGTYTLTYHLHDEVVEDKR